MLSAPLTICLCSVPPRHVPDDVVVVRPAMVQPGGPPGTGVVEIAGTAPPRREQVAHGDAVASTVARAASETTTSVWLCQRDWFVDRLGPGVTVLEDAIATRCRDRGLKLVAWTNHDSPRHLSVYETVEDGSSSDRLALDRDVE